MSLSSFATEYMVYNVPRAEGRFGKIVDNKAELIEKAANELQVKCYKEYDAALDKIMKVYKGQILVDEDCEKQKPIITDSVAFVASHFTIEFKL